MTRGPVRRAGTCWGEQWSKSSSRHARCHSGADAFGVRTTAVDRSCRAPPTPWPRSSNSPARPPQSSDEKVAADPTLLPVRLAHGGQGRRGRGGARIVVDTDQREAIGQAKAHLPGDVEGTSRQTIADRQERGRSRLQREQPRGRRLTTRARDRQRLPPPTSSLAGPSFGRASNGAIIPRPLARVIPRPVRRGEWARRDRSGQAHAPERGPCRSQVLCPVGDNAPRSTSTHCS